MRRSGTLLWFGEIYAVIIMLLPGIFSWFVLKSVNLGLAARLAFYLLIGLAAGGIYWALTSFGLSARPARFIVWGVLAVGFYGLPHLVDWCDGKKSLGEPKDEP